MRVGAHRFKFYLLSKLPDKDLSLRWKLEHHSASSVWLQGSKDLPLTKLQDANSEKLLRCVPTRLKKLCTSDP